LLDSLLQEFLLSRAMASIQMKVEKKSLGDDIFTKAFHSKPTNIKREETQFNSSEVLLESFIEEGQSFIEEGLDAKADLKNAVQRLNNDKIVMLEGKIRTLEKQLEISNEENRSLQVKLDKAESNKVDSDQTIMNLEFLLKDYTEAEQVECEAEGKKTEAPEKETIDQEVQTEVISSATDDEIKDTKANSVANKDSEEKLNEAHKVLVQQEIIIAAKTKEIDLLRRKIKDWGLEDKITEEPNQRRRSVGVASLTGDEVKKEVDDSKTGTELNSIQSKRRASSIGEDGGRRGRPSKTPKEAFKSPKKESKTPKRAVKKLIEEEKEIEIPDTDPNHPTSSFNLRKKGRNHRGKKPLKPMRNLVGPLTETVEHVIVDKGEEHTRTDGIDLYFALRMKKSDQIIAKTGFRNPGPRVGSWKEYRSRYVK